MIINKTVVAWYRISCDRCGREFDSGYLQSFCNRCKYTELKRKSRVKHREQLKEAKCNYRERLEEAKCKYREQSIQTLRQAIGNMTYQQGLYKVLRDELSARGYWQRLPRGNPRKGWDTMKEKQSVKGTEK